MSFAVRAITLDLDDTIWPIAPVMVRAEQVLAAWLREHAPRTAARWTLEARLALPADVASGNPHRAHDLTRQPMMSLADLRGGSGHELPLVHPGVDSVVAA